MKNPEKFIQISDDDTDDSLLENFIFGVFILLIILTILGLFIPFRTAKAATGPFCASGFALSAYNGDYTDASATENGFEYFQNGSQLLYSAGNGYWRLYTDFIGAGGAAYYVQQGGDLTGSEGQWSTDGNGTAPAGTVVSGACGAGGGSSSSTMTSIDTAPSLYFYGIVTFILGFVLVRVIV
jgi:hypothetical protein